MNDVTGFANLPLETMVAIGAVGPDWVRLWCRAAEPGRLTAAVWPHDDATARIEASTVLAADNRRGNTCALQLPAQPGRAGLKPLTRHRFCVLHEASGRELGAGSFETAPASAADTPERFSIAVMSCHQPFDHAGRVMPGSEQMLRAARRVFERHQTKLVFMVGDQLYSDHPPSLSLFDQAYFARLGLPGESIFDCTAEQVRAIYQQRYRHFWNVEPWQALHARYPCYLILDDHDVVDNWGSDPEHQEPRWQAFRAGSERAYFDYQGSRVLPIEHPTGEGFSYSVAYGHTAAFVFDIRTQRRAGDDGQLFSPAQAAKLERFLSEQAERKLLLVVLSVPVIHLPRVLARALAELPPSGEDFSDRWSSGSHLRDRDWLLDRLHQHQLQHPRQQLVLLSGDIHIGCAQAIDYADGVSLHQLVSSPITHEASSLIQIASKLLIQCNRRIETASGARARVGLLRGEGSAKQNPCIGLNVGLLEIETATPGTAPTLRFLLYRHEGDEPRCVFRSAPVGGDGGSACFATSQPSWAS